MRYVLGLSLDSHWTSTKPLLAPSYSDFNTCMVFKSIPTIVLNLILSHTQSLYSSFLSNSISYHSMRRFMSSKYLSCLAHAARSSILVVVFPVQPSKDAVAHGQETHRPLLIRVRLRFHARKPQVLPLAPPSMARSCPLHLSPGKFPVRPHVNHILTINTVRRIIVARNLQEIRTEMREDGD